MHFCQSNKRQESDFYLTTVRAKIRQRLWTVAASQGPQEQRAFLVKQILSE